MGLTACAYSMAIRGTDPMSPIRILSLALLAPALLLIACDDDDGGLDPGENEPPIVSITSPTDGSRCDEGDPIIFGGTALDVEDGMLEEESVVWTPDKDGFLASGTTVTIAYLSPSDHAITITATDSGLATAADVVSIGVDAQPQPPQPPVGPSVQPPVEE